LVGVVGIGMFGIGIYEERKFEVGIFGNLKLDFLFGYHGGIIWE
jgi:hypothetical protein